MTTVKEQDKYARYQKVSAVFPVAPSVFIQLSPSSLLISFDQSVSLLPNVFKKLISGRPMNHNEISEGGQVCTSTYFSGLGI